LTLAAVGVIFALRAAGGKSFMDVLRVLLVSSMPTGSSPFRFDHAQETLTRRLGPVLKQGLVVLEVHPATTVERLGHLLRRRRPDIVHLVCHGTTADGERVLVFEDERGGCRHLNGEELQGLLEAEGVRMPQLLILEACTSLPIAEALVAVVPAVIGMKADARPSDGVHFFGHFYQGLAAGLVGTDAFVEARRDLELLNPTVMDTPVLLGRSAKLDSSVEGFRGPLGRSSGRADSPDQVSRSVAHAALYEPFVGRREELKILASALAWRDERRVLALQGAPGVGKTTLLRRWLDEQTEFGWWGVSRVFTWSFGRSLRGVGCGDVHAFLESALRFFGDRRGLEDEPIPSSAWLMGQRLGRLIRHECFVVVLDGVELLPQGRCRGELDLSKLMHPALAGLLQELARGSAGLLVVALRDEAGLLVEGDGVQVVPIGGICADEGAELLWGAGLVDEDVRLNSLSERLSGHPLALQTYGASFASVDEAFASLGSASGSALEQVLTVLGDRLDAGALGVFRALALRGGVLSPAELVATRTMLGENDPVRALVRPLLRARLATMDRCGGTLRAIHPAFCEALVSTWRGRAEVRRFSGLVPSAAALHGREGGRMLRDIMRCASDLHLALRVGEFERARRLYIDVICRAEDSGPRQSMIARELGAVAEDLSILASFFVRGGDGRYCWAEFVEGEDAPRADSAFILHRLGLALRHLGRAHEGAGPLRASMAVYRELGRWERVATVANDLAELELCRGDLGLALEVAHRAVEAAGEASKAVVDGTAESVGVCRLLAFATLGYAHHLRDEPEEAGAAFSRAEEAIPNSDSPELFSRPGYQYCAYLLGQLEQSIATGGEVHGSALDRLEKRVQNLHSEHDNRWIAPVSRGLDALIAGRVACFRLRQAHEAKEQEAVATSQARATERLAFAVAVFRGNDHVWMLPEALRVRAELRRLVGDNAGADVDHQEVEALARAMLSATGAR